MKKSVRKLKIVVLILIIIILILLSIMGFSYFKHEKSRMNQVTIFEDSIKIGKSNIIIVDFNDINPKPADLVDNEAIQQGGGTMPISSKVGKYRLRHLFYNYNEKSLEAFFDTTNVDCSSSNNQENYDKNKVFSSPFKYYIKVTNIDENWATSNGYLLKTISSCIG